MRLPRSLKRQMIKAKQLQEPTHTAQAHNMKLWAALSVHASVLVATAGFPLVGPHWTQAVIVFAVDAVVDGGAGVGVAIFDYY